MLSLELLSFFLSAHLNPQITFMANRFWLLQTNHCSWLQLTAVITFSTISSSSDACADKKFRFSFVALLWLNERRSNQARLTKTYLQQMHVSTNESEKGKQHAFAFFGIHESRVSFAHKSFAILEVIVCFFYEELNTKAYTKMATF